MKYEERNVNFWGLPLVERLQLVSDIAQADVDLKEILIRDGDEE